MTRNEVFRIVDIFKNDGVDRATGKKVNQNTVYDFIDLIDELVGYEGASEVIFAPEDYGLNKNAITDEIVDYLLKDVKM